MRHNLTWKTSLAHFRQRLCWQGRMTTGLENISRQTGQISCFSRFSTVAPPPAPGPGRPADGGLKPRVKFMITRVGEKKKKNQTRWEEETKALLEFNVHPCLYPSATVSVILLSKDVLYLLSSSLPLTKCVSPAVHPFIPLADCLNPHVKTLPCLRSQFRGSFTVDGGYF